jgi:hypothetical protein
MKEKRYFGGIYHHLQGIKVSQERNQNEAGSMQNSL